MHIVCAWCQTIISHGNTEENEGISHGICPQCAANVLSDKAIETLITHMLEMIRMQGLLLEMVGDLYEVAQAIAPMARVGMKPARSVQEWQKNRK